MADSLIEREPKFGDWLRGIYASERNPTRDGMYVRTIRRTGKLNPGKFYELTDGNGLFWQYPAQSVERLDRTIAAALRMGGEPEWIPVADGLPGATEHVEVWPDPRDDTYCFYAHHDGGTNGVKAGRWYYNDRHGDDYVINVTHWRRPSGPEAKPEAVAEADREEDAYVIQRTCELLARIAIIVNGPEPPLTRWSYHDLPEKVAELKRRSS